MFIELTEILRCPKEHEQSYMICVPMEMQGRQVMRGGVSCPQCGTDFPIIDGLVHMGRAAVQPTSGAAGPLSNDGAQTFLGLEGRGGYILLLGSAGRLVLEGVHSVVVNGPAAPSEMVSVIEAERIPLRSRSIRGAIIGADAAGAAWIEDAADKVLPGLRLVVESESAQAPNLTELARGAGVTVFQK